jgi:transposase
VSKPQVIDDEEHERVHERVAAVDVAKDSGVVCTRLPHPSRPGARRSTVWTVKARMGTIRGLGRQLVRDGIEVVTLESTSDYWRIWFFVLLRHEALFDRMGVKGPCPWAVAAA